jgi:predicted nucleotide-binding protein (sugar kinase/HSP70/actin superfamily)
VYNYINRVVRGRKIGQTIFFQGGTAYNDAVAAAFAAVTGKEIIIPPHNGVIGAIGAALLARECMAATAEIDENKQAGVYISDTQPPRRPTRFRGYNLEQVDYTLREFTCKACSNFCQIQEFSVESEKTYWGDKCSDRYRKAAESGVKPVIEDLFALRQKLMEDESGLPPLSPDAKTVGIPRTMFAMEALPFWRTLFRRCGFNVVLSNPTNKQIVKIGLDTVVAEPCFPIIAAHGHVTELARREDVDYLFVPNILSLETSWTEVESHLCPWHQTVPYVCRQAPAIKPFEQKLLSPTLHFYEGRKLVSREIREMFRPLGVDRRAADAAIREAFLAQEAFRGKLVGAGEKALARLEKTNAKAVLLVGRPYNIHDAGMSLSVASKLRDRYGVNCIPMDFLDVESVDITDINDNMFWSLGRKILAASKLVRQYPNLHIICITNFKCGPDSFVKHFIRGASGKPFLTLQLDGHSNDAGVMTRCEAYLDSIGILRPWKPLPQETPVGRNR